MIDILLFLNHFQKKREENEAYNEWIFLLYTCDTTFPSYCVFDPSKKNYSDQNNLNRTKNK